MRRRACEHACVCSCVCYNVPAKFKELLDGGIKRVKRRRVWCAPHNDVGVLSFGFASTNNVAMTIRPTLQRHHLHGCAVRCPHVYRSLFSLFEGEFKAVVGNGFSYKRLFPVLVWACTMSSWAFFIPGTNINASRAESHIHGCMGVWMRMCVSVACVDTVESSCQTQHQTVQRRQRLPLSLA